MSNAQQCFARCSHCKINIQVLLKFFCPLHRASALQDRRKFSRRPPDLLPVSSSARISPIFSLAYSADFRFVLPGLYLVLFASLGLGLKIMRWFLSYVFAVKSIKSWSESGCLEMETLLMHSFNFFGSHGFTIGHRLTNTSSGIF